MSSFRKTDQGAAFALEVNKDGVTPQSIESLTELAHELSLSDDPIEAAAGRALKTTLPGWLAFLDGEVKADRTPSASLGGFAYAVGTLTKMLAAVTGHDGKELAATLASGFKIALDSTLPLESIDPHKCPHFILVPEHYGEDGACRCHDETASIMAEWGYEWNAETKTWESPPDDGEPSHREADEFGCKGF